MPGSAARRAMAVVHGHAVKHTAQLIQHKRRKQANKTASDHRHFLVHPKVFVFFDKKTGSRRFEVPAGWDGRLPIEKAASLLAIQCVARQQSPADFSILVAWNEDLVASLAGHAKKLIKGCSLPVPRVPLSPRQQAVLRGITHNLTNKEIATSLHVTERTVKFHVSALLEKFDVRRRSELMLEAFDLDWFASLDKRHGTHPAAVPKREGETSGVGEPQLVPSMSDSIARRASG